MNIFKILQVNDMNKTLNSNIHLLHMYFVYNIHISSDLTNCPSLSVLVSMSILFLGGHLHRGIGLMVLQWRAGFYPWRITLHLQTKPFGCGVFGESSR